MRFPLFFLATLALAACGPPVLKTPLTDIPKLTSLELVMDNQATTVDPQFKKMHAATFTDADFAEFAAAAERIQATSLKIKDFSKGPEFDGFAMNLNAGAVALGTAAAAKDASGSSKALADMKQACKSCHSKFR